MNIITKRVPREPDASMLTDGVRVMREFGCTGEDIELRRIASSVYQTMLSRAPIDPLEDAIERYWKRRSEQAA